MLQMTTHGWLRSRAISSRIACRVDLAGGGADRVLAVGRQRLALVEDAAADVEVEADGRRLVDDDDAVAVGVVEDLLGVGIVRGPERVRADPPQQLEVADHHGVVVALAADRRVLVHAEAGEVERLAVDQEPLPVDGDGADPDRLWVGVDERTLRRRASSTPSSYR